MRALLNRLRAWAGGSDRRLVEINRRLERLEAHGEVLEKIWQRTRHLEPAMHALLRERNLRVESLPYPERLTARRFRLSSQNQEDGITLALLEEAGVTSRRFVEIGAGLSGGNSGVLAREFGWSGLMVDGHAGHMAQVARRFPTVKAVAAWVTRDNINEIIANAGYGGEVDLFSLDLDGNDYWIWEAQTACNPRIVILEYNSSFGPERAVTIPYDAQFNRKKHHVMYYGASLAALTRASERKGYRLVAVEPSGVNAFFLRSDVAPHIPSCDPGRAFRLLEKYDVLFERGEDVYRWAQEARRPLVDVS